MSTVLRHTEGEQDTRRGGSPPYRLDTGHDVPSRRDCTSHGVYLHVVSVVCVPALYQGVCCQLRWIRLVGGLTLKRIVKLESCLLCNVYDMWIEDCYNAIKLRIVQLYQYTDNTFNPPSLSLYPCCVVWRLSRQYRRQNIKNNKHPCLRLSSFTLFATDK